MAGETYARDVEVPGTVVLGDGDGERQVEAERVDHGISGFLVGPRRLKMKFSATKSP